MADEIASLKVVIEAEDRASAVISSIGENMNSLGSAGGAAAGQTTALNRTFDNTARSGSSANSTLASYGQQLQQTGKSIKEVGSGIDTITKPLQVAAASVTALGTASAMTAISFEDNFANVKKTVDGTDEQLAQIKQDIIDMTTVGINGHSAIPLTTAELTELAAAGGQLGITVDNIADFTEVMAQMETATNLAGEEGAATLARFQNVMGISQNEIRNVGSAIVDLGNNSATTESEIAAMALRMGKYGSTIGMSAADVLGYSAALSSLGIEAQMGGSAVGRTWLAIETAVASGGKELQTFAKYAGKSANEFKEQWNTDPKGAFNGLLQGLQSAENLTVALDELGINNTQDIQAMMALVNGYDLVTESVERANTAYQENTALQTEFDAKAETTASKIQIVKNNVTEAARSFGEVMLPTIVDVTGGISSMVQGLASANDGTKKLVVSAGAAIVGAGALAKVTASGISTIGKTVETIGKLKEIASGTGALAEFAGGLAAVGSVAGPVAVGIASITAAVMAGKAVYGIWYDSHYNWADSLKKDVESIQETSDELLKLKDYQAELSDLKLIIQSDDSSDKEIETAKERIKEIAEMLSEEYDLKINVDDGDIEAVENALNSQTGLTQSEYNYQMSDLKFKISDDMGTYQDRRIEISELEAQKTAAQEAKSAWQEYYRAVKTVQNNYESGVLSNAEATEKLVEAAKTAKASGLDVSENISVNNMPNLALTVSEIKDLSDEIADYEERLYSLNEAEKVFNTSVEQATTLALNQLKSDAIGKNATEAAQDISDLAEIIDAAGLNAGEYAQKAAIAAQGLNTLDDVVKSGGEAIDNTTRDYIKFSKQFGASATDTAVGASLIKNGLKSISQATDAGALEVVTEQANQLAHSMGLLEEEKHIVINAEGDVSVIEDVQAAVEAVNAAGNVELQVSATGDISALDTADEKLKELIDNNQVTITFNAETKGFNINDLQGNNLGEITADGTVNWKNGEQDEPEEKSTKVNYELGDQAPPENKEAYVDYVLRGSAYKENAKGTLNFPGGLAMVNDDGSSDPRELIIDRGRAFIPEGEDVILPLSRGARVYTSEQTKAIMAGLGIPRYASGKNNSDAFTSAKDDWSHYTKVHSVTTAEELEKWLEFQEQYKDNEKDIWDIEEQIFSLQTKLYSERVKESENWLTHEEKYNGMSVQDYIAGIDRMKAYTAEYYAEGLINYKEYTEALNDLDEKRLDKVKEQLEDMYSLSKDYISEHTYFNDWQDIGDDPLSAYNRVMERNRKALENGELTQEEYDKYKDEIGSDMYDERKEQSLNWLEEQRNYFGLSDKEYVEGLERIKTYTAEYYEQGLISRREYNEAMTELNHSMWDEAADAYDDMLSQQQEYISDLQEQFSAAEQALQDSWTVEDRAADMSDVRAQLEVYAGAVTDAGQKKYKELQEELKQLERDEELYQLQVANNAVIEELQAEYEQLEADKAAFLQSIASNTDINVSGIVGELTSGIEQSSNDITRTLSEIIDAIHGIKMEQQNYTDSRKITNNINYLSGEQLDEFGDYIGR